ncbi:MAG: ATP-binding protein, partial [Gemmatimonadota bacterium]
TEAGIRAYAAVPLKDEGGDTLATLCVVDFEPRVWNSEDVRALSAMAAFLMDGVRERVEAEVALQRSDVRFQSLIENVEDLIAVLTSDLRVKYHGPAYERALGHRSSDLVDRVFTDLIHPDDVVPWRGKFLASLQANGNRSSSEWRMRHADGSWRWVQGTGVNLLDDPAVEGLVINLRDVTEEKQVRAELLQAQKMEAVGRLAGGVAHDFNNLLTAIMGNADFLLSRGDLSSSAEEDVREMVNVAARASGLTRQLLTFTRHQTLETRPLDLGAVVEGAVPLVKRLLGPGRKLEIEAESGLWIVGDDGQLGQVIMNLVINAQDAMPFGGTVRLEARQTVVSDEQVASHGSIQPGRYALLVVADDGEGMSREVQRKVFDPFFTTKSSGKGTGLGLSICWGVVRQMGGHIHLYSEPGKGTVFRIYLPWAAETALGTAADQPDETEPDAPLPPATVWVVDDETGVRRVMRRALERAGHSVVDMASAEEAIQTAEEDQDPPDVLISDVLLPGLTGPEMVARLRAAWPDLPVVFSSGFTRGEMDRHKVSLDDAYFLPKPFDSSQLLAALHRARGGHMGSQFDHQRTRDG